MLHRVFDSSDVGVRARLSRMRIERAKALLRVDPARPFGAVVPASGFASERQFYRVFRQRPA